MAAEPQKRVAITCSSPLLLWSESLLCVLRTSTQKQLGHLPECSALLRRDLGRSLMYLVDSEELLPLVDIPNAATGSLVPRLREALVSLKALAQLNDVVRFHEDPLPCFMHRWLPDSQLQTLHLIWLGCLSVCVYACDTTHVVPQPDTVSLSSSVMGFR